jgi:hypothetical protein
MSESNIDPTRRGFLKSLAAFGVGATAIEAATVESPARNIFAHWWCDLNTYKWPKEWGNPPERFVDKYGLMGREKYEHCKDEYRQIMSVLAKLAGGHREILRVHNVERIKSMDAFQFEIWADQRHYV